MEVREKTRRINWNLLKPEDIEVRVQSVKNGKATMLLYQNSRTAMEAFDEQFGEFGWQIRYEDAGGQIYGILSVYDEERGIWVEKSDTGSESNIEAAKGQSSDIFKRVAVRWGFARELYTAPRIVIEDDGYGNSGYRVEDIRYNDKRQIIYLKIVNKFGKEAFTWSTYTIKDPLNPPKAENKTENKVEKKAETTNYKEMLTAKCSTLKQTENKDEVLKFYNYYIKVIESGWKGKIFDADTLWKRWIDRAN